MSPRSSVVPIVASGTASVVKLLVATLAFTGAYMGVEASQGASAGARAGITADTGTTADTTAGMAGDTVAIPWTAAGAPERTVVLSYASAEISTVAADTAADSAAEAGTAPQADTGKAGTAHGGTVAQAGAGEAGTVAAGAAEIGAARAPAVGTVTVSPLPAPEPCDRPYRVQSVIDNPHPDGVVSYDWRLQRWSRDTRTWRTYLSGNSGFTGRSQVVEWQPHVVGNPGWYRVTLSISGAPALRSAKFLVSC